MDPLEGQVTASDGDKDGGGLERKGGAQIPLLGHMQTDPKTGTLPDGRLNTDLVRASSGHLGLGATADPNQVTQCHDVYISYWKQHGKLSYILECQSSCQMVTPLPFSCANLFQSLICIHCNLFQNNM